MVFLGTSSRDGLGSLPIRFLVCFASLRFDPAADLSCDPRSKWRAGRCHPRRLSHLVTLRKNVDWSLCREFRPWVIRVWLWKIHGRPGRKTIYKFWIYHTYVSFSGEYNSWDILGLYWDLIFAHSAIFSDMDFPASIFVWCYSNEFVWKWRTPIPLQFSTLNSHFGWVHRVYRIQSHQHDLLGGFNSSEK